MGLPRGAKLLPVLAISALTGVICYLSSRRTSAELLIKGVPTLFCSSLISFNRVSEFVTEPIRCFAGLDSLLGRYDKACFVLDSKDPGAPSTRFIWRIASKVFSKREPIWVTFTESALPGDIGKKNLPLTLWQRGSYLVRLFLDRGLPLDERSWSRSLCLTCFIDVMNCYSKAWWPYLPI